MARTQPRKASAPRIREERVLRLLVEGTVAQTGADFFRALVRNLSEALRTEGAWVAEFLPAQRRLRALAFWMGDEFVEGYEYPVDDTPCEAVIDTKSRAHFPDRLIDLFPNDPDVRQLKMVSYLGAPLVDSDGTLLGHLAVMDRSPMPAESGLYELFELFALRAVAEMQRLKAEMAMQEREAQLALLLDTAMDAILVVDAEFRITRVNPRAVELLGCAERDLVGMAVQEFLGATSDFHKLVRDLESNPKPLWLPDGMEVIRPDGTTFPAEAAISRYVFKGGVCFTVFLRSMNERVEAERRIRALTEEAEYLREVAGELSGDSGIIGRSAGIRGVRRAIRQVASTAATVLILGETGAGKELVARAIHDASGRRDGPLVRVNCAAIPENLMESEFFGHEKGAFTGATARREGRFAQAHGGTLFLDEVGELPLDLQAKLLRVLQEGEFEAVGGSRTLKVDVRIVAATNRQIEGEIAAGRFREDLFYRLNVFPIRLPPLRERGEDVILLAEMLANRFAQRMGRRFKGLGEDACRVLRAHDWPGNVRELQNVIERALILSPDQLDIEGAMPGVGSVNETMEEKTSSHRVWTADELEEFEKANLKRALEASGWKISGPDGAATRLGVPASTLASRIRAYGISRPSS